MKILSPAISRLARMRNYQSSLWITQPVETQRQVLQDLITHGQYTSFGRKYGFDTIFNIRDFKAAVPIHEYADLKPYIDEMLLGENHILWNTPTNWFAKSSGTSGDKSKFIPISEQSLYDCHFQAAKDVLSFYYQFNPDSDLLTGKGLVVGGSHKVSNLNNDINCGDLSAVLLQNSPYWSQWIRTPDLSIALMDEWETKIEQLALNTINENVTSLSGVPTWTLILLKKILEISKAQCISEVWPSLELYIHGGVSFVPYQEQFKKIIGKPINYLEMYNASEGFFAAQASPNDDGMLLFLNHGIFYEFLPVDELQKENPKTIGLQQVEVGKNYALVISTNGGLWRYMVGDTIQFTSTFPFRIKVSGRIRHYINAFGEEVIVENTDLALSKAAAKTKSIIADYTAAPKYFSQQQNGAHEWIIEFDCLPKNLDEFTYILDDELKNANSDYEAKRYKDIALSKPIVHVAPSGSFNNWLASKGKLGGQHKVPRLSNSRETLEEILGLINQCKS